MLNLSGVCMCVISLLTEKPAEFTKPLEDKTTSVGKEVSLSCETSKWDGNIKWCKDGKEIRRSQKYDLRQEGARAVLIIHDATVKDSGQYTCETEISKTKATLTVEGQWWHLCQSGWGSLATQCHSVYGCFWISKQDKFGPF